MVTLVVVDVVVFVVVETVVDSDRDVVVVMVWLWLPSETMLRPCWCVAPLRPIPPSVTKFVGPRVALY